MTDAAQSEAVGPPPLRARYLPRRADLIDLIATKTFSVHARAQANAIANTAADLPAPRLLWEDVPDAIEGGRTVPRRFDMQLENVMLRLRDWDRFPSHDGLQFASVLDVAKAIAGWDVNGDPKRKRAPCMIGTVCTVRQIARDSGRDAKTVVKVIRWLISVEWMDAWPRWRAADREETKPGWPATWHRSTVRLLHLLPPDLARGLSHQDLLELAAAQDRREIAPLPPAANDIAGDEIAGEPEDSESPPPPPSKPPGEIARAPVPPKPKRLTLKQIPAEFGLPELPAGANLSGLEAPLARLAKRTGITMSAELAARLAAKEGLLVWAEVAKATAELADVVDGEAIAATYECANPVPWRVRRLVRALQAYFKSKLRWITEGPGALQARQLAAVHEAEYLARKANWALKKARGTSSLPKGQRDEPRSGTDAEMLLQGVQQLRLRWLRSDNDAERRVLEHEMAEVRRLCMAIGPPD